VSYWVRKHGLRSSHAERHAARGGIEQGLLTAIVACGLPIRDMAEIMGRTPLPADAHPELGMCPDHGLTPFVLDRGGDRRCRRCRAESVVRRRRRVRDLLIEEAGGTCAICGFDEHPAALQFHHRDRGEKSFTLRDGDTRALERMREEAAKCVLLCANCHAQVEAGAADLPVTSTGDGALPG
jgi:hypothetical protein